jgi:hypothetical protein
VLEGLATCCVEEEEAQLLFALLRCVDPAARPTKNQRATKFISHNALIELLYKADFYKK